MPDDFHCGDNWLDLRSDVFWTQFRYRRKEPSYVNSLKPRDTRQWTGSPL